MTLDKAALEGRLAQLKNELEQAVAQVNRIAGQHNEVQNMLNYLSTEVVEKASEEPEAQIHAV